MRVESLGFRETDRRRRENAKARGVAADDRRALHEIENAEPGGKAGAARGRQHMVRPGDVITDRLRGIAPEEDRAGVMYLRRERVGILDRQLEMLARDVGPRQVLEMARGGRLDGCGELAAVGH